MNQSMSSLVRSPYTMSTLTLSRPNFNNLSLFKRPKVVACPRFSVRVSPLCCTDPSEWKPSPITYAPVEDGDVKFLDRKTSIFESLSSENKVEAVNSRTQLQFLKWPMWLVGPLLLLGTGMAPTLWLPLSSIFLGSNVVSLLSLIGLDCIFNLGATLFLLMADSCARPKDRTQTGNSRPPFSYRFWNLFAIVVGFIVPLIILVGSGKGILQPQLSFISSAILLGPYFILLLVQMLTEMLTWHWQSPVWLVTPIVYESYRVLQLMRGLKLGVEVCAPEWMVHMIRGLVSWWVLILCLQLMRVAWFAGFSSREIPPQSSPSAS